MKLGPSSGLNPHSRGSSSSRTVLCQHMDRPGSGAAPLAAIAGAAIQGPSKVRRRYIPGTSEVWPASTRPAERDGRPGQREAGARAATFRAGTGHGRKPPVGLRRADTAASRAGWAMARGQALWPVRPRVRAASGPGNRRRAHARTTVLPSYIRMPGALDPRSADADGVGASRAEPCGCRKCCHPMRPAHIRGSGHRAGPGVNAHIGHFDRRMRASGGRLLLQ
jgi:hypothetical protein